MRTAKHYGSDYRINYRGGISNTALGALGDKSRQRHGSGEKHTKYGLLVDFNVAVRESIMQSSIIITFDSSLDISIHVRKKQLPWLKIGDGSNAHVTSWPSWWSYC
jgi:hypothetical protein